MIWRAFVVIVALAIPRAAEAQWTMAGRTAISPVATDRSGQYEAGIIYACGQRNQPGGIWQSLGINRTGRMGWIQARRLWASWDGGVERELTVRNRNDGASTTILDRDLPNLFRRHSAVRFRAEISRGVSVTFAFLLWEARGALDGADRQCRRAD